MQRVVSFYRTSIGKKYVMSLSGIILILYVIGHMAGNLKVFQGPEKFNAYAEFLREVGEPIFGHGELLWVARIILLVALFAHIIAFAQLWRQSSKARRVKYEKYDPQLFSAASATMKWGGITILLFVIYHLLHLTFGTVHAEFSPGNPYHNVVVGFQFWPNVLFYTAGVIALGFHLYHGTWSMFQTLGANNRKYNRYRRPLALGIAVLTTIGYLAIPAGVLTGIVE